MEPWMTVVIGILGSAVFAGIGRWKAAGEPTDPKKVANTLGFGIALSLVVAALQYLGVDQNVAYPIVMLMFAMAGITMAADGGAKGVVRRRPEVPKKRFKADKLKKKEKKADSEE